MASDKTPVYKFWNGKNPEGGPVVGDKNLIGERPRHGKTNAKYEVGGDTTATDDLQNSPRQ